LLGGATELVVEGDIAVDPEQDSHHDQPPDTVAPKSGFETAKLIDGIRHGLGVRK